MTTLAHGMTAAPSKMLLRGTVTVALWLLGTSACSGKPGVIFETNSKYNHIYVTEDHNGVRSLYFDDGSACQSEIDPGRPQRLRLAYTRAAMSGLALVPNPKRALFVGLGGGAMPMYLRHLYKDLVMDVVEIDPVVVEVARTYFGYRQDARIHTHVGDGRTFVEQRGPAYDLIVLDAFSDDGVPYHLTTVEFLRAVKARLAPSGVVVANVWSSSRYFRPMLRSYAHVFAELHLVRAGHTSGRIILALGTARELDEYDIRKLAGELHRTVKLGFDLPNFLTVAFDRVPKLGPGKVLRDRRPPTGTR